MNREIQRRLDNELLEAKGLRDDLSGLVDQFEALDAAFIVLVSEAYDAGHKDGYDAGFSAGEQAATGDE